MRTELVYFFETKQVLVAMVVAHVPLRILSNEVVVTFFFVNPKVVASFYFRLGAKKPERKTKNFRARCTKIYPFRHGIMGLMGMWIGNENIPSSLSTKMAAKKQLWWLSEL